MCFGLRQDLQAASRLKLRSTKMLRCKSIKTCCLLAVGMALGFTISSVFHGGTDGFSSPRKRLALDEAAAVAAASRKTSRSYDSSLGVGGGGGRPRVGFANLMEERNPDAGAGNSVQEAYDYDSLILSEDSDEQDPNGRQEQNDQAAAEGFGWPAYSKEKALQQQPVIDPQLLQKVYAVEKNWHGRNVRETNPAAGPLNKLTDELAPRRTVLVAVVTSVSHLMSQTLAVHGTWAGEASMVIYFTGEVESMPHLPHGMVVVQLEGIDDKQASWDVKEFATIQYLIDRYLHEVDWFFITGDEVYVVEEALVRTLNQFDASLLVYMGRPLEDSSGEERERREEEEEENLEGEDGAPLSSINRGGLCSSVPGVVYSKGLLEKLRPYLPLCWPGRGELSSIGGCITVMSVRCTQAKETKELFLSDAKLIVESQGLFANKHIAKALAIHPVRFPKFLYRLHSYFKEHSYNASTQKAANTQRVIKDAYPFIPSHLRSPFQFDKQEKPVREAPPTTSSAQQQQQRADNGGVIARPRYKPKNKFEVINWEYFNQTRLMTIMDESPSRGIIGGIREEARHALTKAIYIANQGVPQNQRFVFEKLENGYHRVDPMRGSEYILDFVFRRSIDKNAKVKKRVSILRPFHETVLPISSPEMLPTVNFMTVLSGLSNRLEKFLQDYEKNILQRGEDATLNIVLFNSPDAAKVRLMVDQYLTRYQGAKIYIIDAPGEFARGIGLHHGAERLRDDQLVFFVDVDLDVAPQFLQRCRLNTIQGKQVYFPIFFKMYNPEFVQKYYQGNATQILMRQNGHWAHYSYGMLCTYVSDYRKAGGFDLEMRGWGEEDVDYFNRVLHTGFEVFRAPDPGLVHNWHPKFCNQDTVKSKAAYVHCLRSKAENLADRIELANYVFQNELIQGNVF